MPKPATTSSQPSSRRSRHQVKSAANGTGSVETSEQVSAASHQDPEFAARLENTRAGIREFFAEPENAAKLQRALAAAEAMADDGEEVVDLAEPDLDDRGSEEFVRRVRERHARRLAATRTVRMPTA